MHSLKHDFRPIKPNFTFLVIKNPSKYTASPIPILCFLKLQSRELKKHGFTAHAAAGTVDNTKQFF
jgi:hypothetical protein